MKVLIRTIKEFDLDEICQHLLVVGDLTGDCFKCRELGLNYANVKSCPKCNTEFRYITSRKTSDFGLKNLSILCRKRPDLICIEFNDLKHHQSREKARDFLS
ncbi:MAG: hypothetical protein PHS93_04800 [Candidatus Omnitrophica bacterium]|nr:hypothetical protein [Candidatus Omnitrophota bacterium]MDD5352471.1 hypothetical protein [Candidatus Omnitrophota bacterium]MDD5550069.1 hypothetical protein [Candidatus Omnitrophota bacterium]